MATEYFQNEVTFTSIDRFDSNGLVGEPQKVLVPATFRRPLGEGKFPAIVIANSSAGVIPPIDQRRSSKYQRRMVLAANCQPKLQLGTSFFFSTIRMIFLLT